MADDIPKVTTQPSCNRVSYEHPHRGAGRHPGRGADQDRASEPPAVEAPPEDSGSAKVEPHALLRYYKSAIRSDPRGARTEPLDRHGVTFQLVVGEACIWSDEEGAEVILRARLEDLRGELREALIRRDANENGIAVGWPLQVGERSGVPVIRPVGLLAATWHREGDDLVVTVEGSQVLPNPDWISAQARLTAWSDKDLRALFDSAEGVGLPAVDFLARLREAAATTTRSAITGLATRPSLDPSERGLHDAIALFLPNDSTFTMGAVRDLDAIAHWPTERLAQTALAPLLNLAWDGNGEGPHPINLGPTNAEQLNAVAASMRTPLSVVTGPPGTGKSQAITAIAATAIEAGQTVLVASKNHQALDAVEDRLKAIAPDTPFAVRTLDPAREIDVSVKDVLKSIVNEPIPTGHPTDPQMTASLRELARRRAEALATLDEVTALNCRIADLLERQAFFEKAGAVGQEHEPHSPGWLVRLLILLRLRRPERSDEASEPDLLRPKDIPAVLRVTRDKCNALEQPEDVFDLSRKIEELAGDVLRRALRARCKPDDGVLEQFTIELADLELNDAAGLASEMALRTVSLRPLWLASILGAPKRLPLETGLFDLLIIDEASQCDIGTALPLFARARRAVVVGDSMQLSFIPQLSAAQDRNLMAAQGLPASGMGRFAQGRRSLFDLASSTPGVERTFLRNQYRSHPDIVDYLNEEFYGNRLRSAVNGEHLKCPPRAKPGIAWTHVPARHGEFGRNVNEAEAAAIASEVVRLVKDPGFDGSIGVIAPFRPQVLAIEQKLRAAIHDNFWSKTELRVATVDGFQGQERDVILFSPVVSSSSPTSAITFLQRDVRRMNVAISRARAIAHVFGDLTFARSGKVRTLARLASKAGGGEARVQGEGVFDSEWERIVHYALLARGLKPEPQYPVAGRRLDFALFKNGVKLDLEVDGRRWHQDIDGNRKTGDLWRDAQLRALGWKIRRFWVDELANNLEGCLDVVERDLS